MSNLSITVSSGENLNAVDVFKNGIYILVDIYGLEAVINADETKQSNQRIITKDKDDFPTSGFPYQVIHDSGNYYINVRYDNPSKESLLKDIISTLNADSFLKVELYQ